MAKKRHYYSQHVVVVAAAVVAVVISAGGDGDSSDRDPINGANADSFCGSPSRLQRPTHKD